MKSKLLLKLLRCKHKSDVKAILKQLPKCSVVFTEGPLSKKTKFSYIDGFKSIALILIPLKR